jgi:hypothetical protein
LLSDVIAVTVDHPLTGISAAMTRVRPIVDLLITAILKPLADFCPTMANLLTTSIHFIIHRRVQWDVIGGWFQVLMEPLATFLRRAWAEFRGDIHPCRAIRTNKPNRLFILSM